MPLEFVTAVAAEEPAKLALGPVPGAVKVTVTPLIGLPPASLTVACSGVLNAVLVVVFWGVPPVATILAGLPALLVRLKLAEVPTPETLAVTE